MFTENLPIGEPNPRAPETTSTPTATWWFWVKAGMGFTLGASIMGLVCAVTWWLVIFPAWLNLIARGLEASRRLP